MTSVRSNSETTEKVTFRIPSVILDQVDRICSESDMSRSQYIRKCVAISVLPEAPDEAPPHSNWGESLYVRLEKQEGRK